MADEAAAFTLTCELLDQRTELNIAQIRGTVRLALQEAGLFDTRVSHAEMAVVAEKLLPRELAAGGVVDAEELCRALSSRLSATPDREVRDSPDAVFARLGVTA